MDSNQPISEQFRLAGEAWSDAERAASLMERTRDAVFSDMIGKLLGENIGMAVNKAEIAARSSPEYREFVTKMVQMRRDANLLKVQMEVLRMRFQEWSSHEANARAEKRL
jgi:hypothetical protein